MMLPAPYYRSADGSVEIHCGDCLDLLPLIPSGSVPLVATDPPYSSGGQFRGDRQRSTRDKYQSTGVIEEHPDFDGDSRDQRGWMHWMALWLIQARRASMPGAMMLTFCDWRQLPTCTDAVQCGGWVWRGIVPWDKVVARPQPGRFRAQAEYIVWATNGPRAFDYENAVYLDGVLRVRIPQLDDREHSTQKPDELVQQLLPAAIGDGPILDPFLGSGTTAVACIKTGRRCIGIELSEAYCAIAARRCEEAFESQGLFRQGRANHGGTESTEGAQSGGGV